VVNGRLTPKAESARPANPMRPNAMSSANPATVGGSTIGRSTSTSTSRLPRKLRVASSHAVGVPSTTITSVAAGAGHEAQAQRVEHLGLAEPREELARRDAEQEPEERQRQKSRSAPLAASASSVKRCPARRAGGARPLTRRRGRPPERR
jgi:hypothetical protein